MAEKQERSSTRDFHSCSSKLVCPVSLVSLLICTAALVRVEIINQRVHDVEDLVADARQNQNLIKVSTDAASFKRPKRVEPDGEFNHKIIEERQDVTQVHHSGKTRRSSSKAGSDPNELTMETVRSEINKTLNSLTSRSFCSPKQQICVQGPPGIQGRKGSHGRRGPRGVTGKKGSSGSRGKEGRRGIQGIIGPPGAKGDQGIMGPPGQKGEQGIMGPPGQNGEQGIMGKMGPKGNQGVMGSAGQKGNQGFMGPPGAKGDQGIMGPPGQKGEQGNMGPPGQNGEQGIMGKTGSKGNQGVRGSRGPKGNQGFMGPPGPKGTMGTKGEQGITGVPGPRGILGAKGEPGDSFSPPTMVIFPRKQLIAQKHNAVFQCTVVGNPKPTITWLGKSSSPLRSQDGRLDLGRVNFDDAGEYTCIGRNSLGITSQTASLTVKFLGPECINYTSLTSGDRKTTYKTTKYLCDNNLNGWYRFQGAAGTRMPTSCPPKDRCGTAAPGWLDGSHPTVTDGKVSRRVCFSYNGCCWVITTIQVRNCGSHYVYYFNGTPNCSYRYCSTD